MARRGENIHKRKDGRWEGRYIKARTPEGKNPVGLYLWYGLCGGQTGADPEKKAEAGFYNLKRTDLTFEALAEVWLHSLRNSIKGIHLCALFVHTAQVSSSGFERSARCIP